MRSSSGTSTYDRPAHHGRSKAMNTSGARFPAAFASGLAGRSDDEKPPPSRAWRSPKSGRPVVIEGDDLAVDDRLRRREPGRRAQELREVAAGVVPVARAQLHLPCRNDRLDPVAVPLRLEEPVVAVERRAPRCRQHRLEERRLGAGSRASGIERGQGRRRRAVGARRDGWRPPRRSFDRLDRRGKSLRIPAGNCLRAGLRDEEPGGTLVVDAGHATAPAAVAGPDQREPPGQLLPAQPELQLARPDGLAGVPGQLRLEGAPVPADRIASAVLALRDDPLEVEVLDRVVLGPGSEPALVGIARGALGEGP